MPTFKSQIRKHIKSYITRGENEQNRRSGSMIIKRVSSPDKSVTYREYNNDHTILVSNAEENLPKALDQSPVESPEKKKTNYIKMGSKKDGFIVAIIKDSAQSNVQSIASKAKTNAITLHNWDLDTS